MHIMKIFCLVIGLKIRGKILIIDAIIINMCYTVSRYFCSYSLVDRMILSEGIGVGSIPTMNTIMIIKSIFFEYEIK